MAGLAGWRARQLRHAVEPDARRAADRPHRSGRAAPRQDLRREHCTTKARSRRRSTAREAIAWGCSSRSSDACNRSSLDCPERSPTPSSPVAAAPRPRTPAAGSSSKCPKRSRAVSASTPGSTRIRSCRTARSDSTREALSAARSQRSRLSAAATAPTSTTSGSDNSSANGPSISTLTAVPRYRRQRFGQ